LHPSAFLLLSITAARLRISGFGEIDRRHLLIRTRSAKRRLDIDLVHHLAATSTSHKRHYDAPRPHSKRIVAKGGEPYGEEADRKEPDREDTYRESPDTDKPD